MLLSRKAGMRGIRQYLPTLRVAFRMVAQKVFLELMLLSKHVETDVTLQPKVHSAVTA